LLEKYKLLVVKLEREHEAKVKRLNAYSEQREKDFQATMDRIEAAQAQMLAFIQRIDEAISQHAIDAAVEAQKELYDRLLLLQHVYGMQLQAINEELASNRSQIQKHHSRVNEIDEKILESGFLEKMHEIDPSKSVEMLRECYDQCRYSADQSIKTTKDFVSKFSNLSGIAEELIDKGMEELGLNEASKEKDAVIEDIEKIEEHCQNLEAAKEVLNENIEIVTDQLKRVDGLESLVKGELTRRGVNLEHKACSAEELKIEDTKAELDLRTTEIGLAKESASIQSGEPIEEISKKVDRGVEIKTRLQEIEAREKEINERNKAIEKALNNADPEEEKKLVSEIEKNEKELERLPEEEKQLKNELETLQINSKDQRNSEEIETNRSETRNKP